MCDNFVGKETGDGSNKVLNNLVYLLNDCEEPTKDHAELCKATDTVLHKILDEDAVLSDLSGFVSLEEVEAQVSLIKGQVFTVFVERENFPTLRVIIPEAKATVIDLKKAIKHSFELQQKKDKEKYFNSARYPSKSSTGLTQTNVSFRYIWRTYLLTCENQLLTDDRQSLSRYGVVNKSILKFVKRSKVKRLPYGVRSKNKF